MKMKIIEDRSFDNFEKRVNNLLKKVSEIIKCEYYCGRDMNGYPTHKLLIIYRREN